MQIDNLGTNSRKNPHENHVNKNYGIGDTSFIAAGGKAGVLKLVNEFYDQMQTLSQAKRILAMHADDLTESREKLHFFLCGWLGGPRLYQHKYGGISIPRAHSHLKIGLDERDAWLLCMQEALDKQTYEESFKQYLMTELKKPAEACRTI